MMFTIHIISLVVVLVTADHEIESQFHLEVKNQEFPYLAALLHHNQYLCPAAIVSNRILITDANCIFSTEPEEYSVRIESDFADRDGRMVYVRHIVTNQKYKHVDYKIASIILRKQIHFTDKVNKINWAPISQKPFNLDPISLGTEVDFIGYDYNFKMVHVKKVIVEEKKCTYHSEEECKQHSHGFDDCKDFAKLFDKIFCAKALSESNVKADGMLVYNNTLIGVLAHTHVSFDNDIVCAFTNIA